jgi:hypothetical protein
MKRFIQEEHRTQGTLLPEQLDDYIGEKNSVRVVEPFSKDSTWTDWGSIASCRPRLGGQPIIRPFCSKSTFTATSIVSSPATAWKRKHSSSAVNPRDQQRQAHALVILPCFSYAFAMVENAIATSRICQLLINRPSAPNSRTSHGYVLGHGYQILLAPATFPESVSKAPLPAWYAAAPDLSLTLEASTKP